MQRHTYFDSHQRFLYGKVAYNKAREAAKLCGLFVIDCDDELVDSNDISCYNCLFRRWDREAFVCLKQK